jgi:hypothetical protein
MATEITQAVWDDFLEKAGRAEIDRQFVRYLEIYGGLGGPALTAAQKQSVWEAIEAEAQRKCDVEIVAGGQPLQ